MRTDRITPDNITALEPDTIFVFGSNGEGIHAGGAARIAHDKFGAKMGQGYGLQGQSFAINTMSGLNILYAHIKSFTAYAEAMPDKVFLVTEIGCGIAGYQPPDIAPLFAQAVTLPNVHLPKRFWDVLEKHL